VHPQLKLVNFYIYNNIYAFTWSALCTFTHNFFNILFRLKFISHGKIE
jgi:hypothetical protein